MLSPKPHPEGERKTQVTFSSVIVMIWPLVCSSHFIWTLKSSSIPRDIDAFTSSLLPVTLSWSGQMFTSREASAEPGNPSEGMTSLGLPRHSHCLFRCLQSGGVKHIAVHSAWGGGRCKGKAPPWWPCYIYWHYKEAEGRGEPSAGQGSPWLDEYGGGLGSGDHLACCVRKQINAHAERV